MFLPYLDPTIAYHELELYGGGITAFIGAVIFEIGSLLLVVEAFCASQSGCFGWALEKAQLNEKSLPVVRAVPDDGLCQHHHTNRKSLVGISPAAPSDALTWWPTGQQFRRHYFHDLGFLAAIAELLGSTLFVVSGFGSLPTVYNAWKPGSQLVMYWLPQIAGSLFYVIASILFMLETQKNWWTPALRTLGWHVGFWSLVGGVGFLLFPVFALENIVWWAEYQAACSNFWGSWAFLLSSVLQLYESLNKHPVERHW